MIKLSELNAIIRDYPVLTFVMTAGIISIFDWLYWILKLIIKQIKIMKAGA